MARTKTTRANPAPGAGVIFALRAIGLVLLVRWLHAMAQMEWSTVTTMVSSPWACLNLVFLFLLLSLPGAAARAERPAHPLPQWLRQALRLLALLCFLFAAWSVGAYIWFAGWRRALHAVMASNGWLVAAPVLYAAVVWICRPQPLWRTHIAARRFAIGRYAISIDVLTRTVVVWMESRKVGQYDARELAIRWPRGTVLPPAALDPAFAPDEFAAPVPAMPANASDSASVEPLPASLAEPVVEPAHVQAEAHALHDAPAAATAVAAPIVESAEAGQAPAVAQPNAVEPEPESTAPTAPAAEPSRHGVPSTSDMPRGKLFSRPRVELLWNSPAAAGHNREIVMRAPLATEGDRNAARALDATLRQFV